MKNQAPSPILSISEWLDIATEGLALSARHRIASEIKGHYDEALQIHLANGQTPLGATLLAMEDLGAPQAAAKVYRRTYLTNKEDLRIAKLIGAAHGALRFTALFNASLAALFFASGGFRFLPWHGTIYSSLLIFLSLLGFGLILILARKVLKNFSGTHAVTRLVLLRAAVSIVACLYVLGLPMGIGALLKPLLFAFAIADLCSWLRLLAKVLKTAPKPRRSRPTPA